MLLYMHIHIMVAQTVNNPPAMRETWVGSIPYGRVQLPTPVFSHTHTQRHLADASDIHIATPWLKCNFTFLLNESHSVCNSIDCSPLGSSVHGVLWERILPWVAILFFWGSSWQRDQSQNSALQVDSLPSEPAGPPKFYSDPK